MKTSIPVFFLFNGFELELGLRLKLHTNNCRQLTQPSLLFFSLVYCSVVYWVWGSYCWRIFAAAEQPPPNVMTSSREILHTAGSSGAPDFRGVRPAPRHKPHRCTVLSLWSSPSHSLPLPLLICLFSPPFSLCLFFSLLHFDTPSLSKSLAVHLKSALRAGQTQLIYETEV